MVCNHLAMLRKQVETAKLADGFEEDGVAACHVLQGMIGVRWVSDHLEEAASKLQLPIVDRSGDAIEVGKEGFHPPPIPSLYARFPHPQDFLHACELGAELRNAGFAHAVVTEDEEGGEDAVVAGSGGIT